MTYYLTIRDYQDAMTGAKKMIQIVEHLTDEYQLLCELEADSFTAANQMCSMVLCGDRCLITTYMSKSGVINTSTVTW